LSTGILDDPDGLKRIDKSDMLSFCVEAPEHCQKAAKLAWAVPINYSKPKTIIIAGLGGSAIGGELLKDWAMDKIAVPIEVCRSYSLPAYVNEKTLAFVISYSGETEEALSMFLDTTKRNCMTFCISSGGKLLQFAEKLKLPHLQVPSGMPPRAALPYLFLPMLIILEKLGLVSGVSSEISEAIKALEQVKDENSPETPLDDNFSKVLASKINGTVPIIYGFGIYRAVAERYKQQFNENSKVPAKWEFFPELNHNEIVGWESAKELANCFSTIFIRDEDEREEIRQRIEVTKELMFGEAAKRIFEVWSVGESRLTKMLYAIYIGDFTSVYLAILRGVDPTPVKTITLLKQRITQRGVKGKIIGELQKLCKK
jgi:glucose/mannose-6-phosphate isomerase